MRSSSPCGCGCVCTPPETKSVVAIVAAGSAAAVAAAVTAADDCIDSLYVSAGRDPLMAMTAGTGSYDSSTDVGTVWLVWPATLVVVGTVEPLSSRAGWDDEICDGPGEA